MNRLLLLLLFFSFLNIIQAQNHYKKERWLTFLLSIVPNGEFEKKNPYFFGPSGWDMPDGLGVKWQKAPIGEKRIKRGKAISLNTAISEIAMNQQWKKLGIKKWQFPSPKKNPIAATYGLSFYSSYIPIKKYQAYCVFFDFKSPKKCSGGKLWIRGYGTFRGEKRRLYETIVNCHAENSNWKEFYQVFHPTKYTSNVTEIRVMLYAYWPAGTYWFDNVRIIPIDKKVYQREKIKNDNFPKNILKYMENY